MTMPFLCLNSEQHEPKAPNSNVPICCILGGSRVLFYRVSARIALITQKRNTKRALDAAKVRHMATCVEKARKQRTATHLRNHVENTSAARRTKMNKVRLAG